MMSPKELRNEIVAGMYSKRNYNNGYWEKLGIIERLEAINGPFAKRECNLYTLDDFRKKTQLADKLIEEYINEGNDLRSEIAFRELKEKVDLIFKPKGFFSFFN